MKTYGVTFLLGVIFGAFVVALSFVVSIDSANQKKQAKTLTELKLKNDIAAIRNSNDQLYCIGKLIKANNKIFEKLEKQQKQIDSLKNGKI